MVCGSLPSRLPARYVFSLVVARATERGLQSAGVLVSEGGFGILPSVTCSRSSGINPAPRRDSGWGANHAGILNIAIIFRAGQCQDSVVRSEGHILIPPPERSLQAA